jgi:hypothetical protein
MQTFRIISVLLLGAAVLLASQWCACGHSHNSTHEPVVVAARPDCGHACVHHAPVPAPVEHDHDHDCCCSAPERPLVPGDGGVRLVRSTDWTAAEPPQVGIGLDWADRGRPKAPRVCLWHPPPQTPIALGVLLTV